MVPEKGIHFLLDQWAAHSEWPQLIIAGTGPLQAEVESRAANLPHVRYVGEVKGGAKTLFLAGCLATVVPSEWWEVLGLVVFESYAHDKPVIASRTGGLGEIVKDGVTGFQFTPSDAASFQHAMTRLLTTPASDRHLMGQRGRLWANEHTHPERWKQHYAAITRTAVAPHAQP